MSSNLPTRRVLDFLSSLDISGDPPEKSKSVGLPEDLTAEFSSESDLCTLARGLQDELSRSPEDADLVRRLAGRINADPRVFLLVMHTVRQIRFTNLELVRVLFDPSRLDSPEYYESLCMSDDAFKATFDKMLSRSGFTASYSGIDAERLTQAVGKQTVHAYLGSGLAAWKRWKARIHSDQGVAQRVSEFAVLVEDFGALVREGVVVQTLMRSLRTANVETVKAERGKFGAGRIRDLLLRSGFTSTDRPGHHNTLSELATSANRRLDRGFFFASEVAGARRKRFDFALFSANRVRFLIETTYYTTSMSKIGEVVKDFTGLRNQLPADIHLFFVTDGVGWFGRSRDVEEMLSLNQEIAGQGIELPFLLNLSQFERLVPSIKLLLSSN